jgi:hypothetical protein
MNREQYLLMRRERAIRWARSTWNEATGMTISEFINAAIAAEEDVQRQKDAAYVRRQQEVLQQAKDEERALGVGRTRRSAPSRRARTDDVDYVMPD